MRSVLRELPPFLPALLLAFFGAWAGSFVGGASAWGLLVGHLVLVALVVWGGGSVGDPLCLGREGRLVLFAAAVGVLGSWLASPVARAGRVGMGVAALLVLVPSIVARVWSEARARRFGVRAVGLVVAGISVWSLVGWALGATQRPSAPLGHHGLLSLYLIGMLPLAWSLAREPGRWKWVGWGSGFLGLFALLGTRSMASAAAVVVVALFFGWGGRGRVLFGRRVTRSIVVLVLGVLGLGFWFGPRLMEIARGADGSVAARGVYWRAGLAGISERPWVGWGPGSTGWTISQFLRPRPGVNPPGEIVADLHSWPLQMAYELGLPVLVLVLAAGFLFFRQRFLELRAEPDPVREAGLLGLLGLGIAACGTAWHGALAIPVVAAIAAGAALSNPRANRGEEPGARRLAEATNLGAGSGARRVFKASNARERWLGRAVALATVPLFLLPDLAALQAERALTSRDPAAELQSARDLDPRFPIYNARWASLQRQTDSRATIAALRAAQDAHGVAVYWLAAGQRGLATREPWAATALERACDLDPFDGFAPFFRLREGGLSPQAEIEIGARALLAEPRLGAARGWPRGLLLASARRLEGIEGLDAGWRSALVGAVLAAERLGPEPEIDWLTFGGESSSASSSLHLFRRRGSSGYLGAVALRRNAFSAFDLPAASTLSSTAPELFFAPRCRLGPPVSGR